MVCADAMSLSVTGTVVELSRLRGKGLGTEAEDSLDKLLKVTLEVRKLLTHPVAVAAVVTQVDKPAPIALQ